MLIRRLDFGRTDLVLRSGPNWIAAIFFAVMAVLNLAIALPDMVGGELGSEISLGLGVFFAAIAAGCAVIRRQVAVLANARIVRTSYILGPEWFARRIPFEQVLAVKLTLKGKRRPRRPRIEVQCLKEAVECPVTTVPQQQALCMAMTMCVRLIKVCPDEPFAMPNRISGLPFDAMRGDEPNR